MYLTRIRIKEKVCSILFLNTALIVQALINLKLDGVVCHMYFLLKNLRTETERKITE